jgi:hypothetical protein
MHLKENIQCAHTLIDASTCAKRCYWYNGVPNYGLNILSPFTAHIWLERSSPFMYNRPKWPQHQGLIDYLGTKYRPTNNKNNINNNNTINIT